MQYKELSLTLGVRGGEKVREGGEICIIMAGFAAVWKKSTKYCKAIFLQLNNNNKKNKQTEPGLGSVISTFLFSNKKHPFT